jgi:hypothetical protein
MAACVAAPIPFPLASALAAPVWAADAAATFSDTIRRDSATAPEPPADILANRIATTCCASTPIWQASFHNLRGLYIDVFHAVKLNPISLSDNSTGRVGIVESHEPEPSAVGSIKGEKWSRRRVGNGNRRVMFRGLVLVASLPRQLG